MRLRPVAGCGWRPVNPEGRVPGFHLRVLRRLARPHGIRNRVSCWCLLLVSPAGVSCWCLLLVSVVGEGDPRLDGRAVVFVRARAGCARSVRDARVGGPVIRDTKAGEGGVAQRGGVGKLRDAGRERLAHPCSAGNRRRVPDGDVPRSRTVRPVTMGLVRSVGPRWAWTAQGMVSRPGRGPPGDNHDPPATGRRNGRSGSVARS